MAYFCQACGKEMDHDEEFCEECKKEMSILDNEPAPQSAPARPAPAAPAMNEPKKGNGPAIAALILSIIGFFTTVIMCLVFNTLIKTPEFIDAFVQTFRDMAGTGGFPKEILEISVKLAFSFYYYAGGLFMLIALICFLVALVKYLKNTTPNKAKSVLIIACVAAAFVLISFIIATASFASASKIIDTRILPYL